MLSQQLSDATIYRITTVAAAAWLVHDSLLVLNDEIRLIWRSPRSLPKVLYLICRYGGLATSIPFAVVSMNSYSLPSCVASTAMIIFSIPVSMAADGLLLLRVLALYRVHEFLCRLLIAFYLLEKLAEIGLTCVGVYGGVLLEMVYDMPCPSTLIGNSMTSLSTGIPAFGLNAVLFGLTVAKVVPYWRMRQFGMAPFLEAFVRDGALYFLIICCVLMVDIFLPVFLLSSISPTIFIEPWILSAYPIAACRLLLELRCSVNRPTLETTVQTTDAQVPTFAVPSSEPYSEPLSEMTNDSTLEMDTFDESRSLT